MKLKKSFSLSFGEGWCEAFLCELRKTSRNLSG